VIAGCQQNTILLISVPFLFASPLGNFITLLSSLPGGNITTEHYATYSYFSILRYSVKLLSILHNFLLVIILTMVSIILLITFSNRASS